MVEYYTFISLEFRPKLKLAILPDAIIMKFSLWKATILFNVMWCKINLFISFHIQLCDNLADKGHVLNGCNCKENWNIWTHIEKMPLLKCWFVYIFCFPSTALELQESVNLMISWLWHGMKYLSVLPHQLISSNWSRCARLVMVVMMMTQMMRIMTMKVEVEESQGSHLQINKMSRWFNLCIYC